MPQAAGVQPQPSASHWQKVSSPQAAVSTGRTVQSLVQKYVSGWNGWPHTRLGSLQSVSPMQNLPMPLELPVSPKCPQVELTERSPPTTDRSVDTAVLLPHPPTNKRIRSKRMSACYS